MKEIYEQVFFYVFNIIKKLQYCFLIQNLFCQMDQSNISKDHHWKMIVNRKNRMEKEFQTGLINKRKFTPLKDNSMNSSRIFQRSRQRSNSSIHGINKSKDIDSVSTRQYKNDRVSQSIKNPHPQNSVVISNIKIQQNRITDSIILSKVQGSSNMNKFHQIQKQFKQFKQKILKQLQRQQEIINKMAKQIIVTFQYQLGKIKQSSCDVCQYCKDHQKGNNSSSFSGLKENSNKLLQKGNIVVDKDKKISIKETKDPNPKQKIKQLEQIKSQLNKRIQKHQPLKQGKQKTLSKVRSTRQIPVLNFQSVQNKFQNFFDIFNKLKEDINQIEEINDSLAAITSPMSSPRNISNIK